MRNKLELTQTLLAQLPEGHGISLDEAMNTWWMNLRAQGGLRLTFNGYRVFRQLGLESWNVTVDPQKVNKQLILALDKKLQYPYYIEVVKHLPKNLVMFSSKEAMMALLYGDLKTFLNNYS